MVDALPDVLFYVTLVIAGVAWGALIIFPRQPWANFWFAGLTAPLLLGVLYTSVMTIYWFQPPVGTPAGFLSLDGFGRLLENRGLRLAAYIDLMVMPLLVGTWMARKAAQLRMPFVYLLPCLIITLVLPGTGFVLFAIFVAMGQGWARVAKFEAQPPATVDAEPALPMAASASR